MSEDNDLHKKITRRRFIKRIAKAGISIAAAGTFGYLLYDGSGPAPFSEDEEMVTLPDFSVLTFGKRMAIVNGADRVKDIEKAFAALGGIETFVKKGDRVLLKVNAAFASPPSLSATSHPDLVRAVIRLCFKAGAAEVRVTDNPINDPESCFKLTGIAQAVESEGGKLILPKENYFKLTTLKGGSLIKNWQLLYEPFKGITKLIGLAPIKDHHRSGASMTMKNWYGLLGGPRNIFHQDVHSIIKELAMMVRPTLVILDGTTTMMSNGPTGGSLSDLKQTNTMIVSTDQVAADACGASLLGKTIADLPFISKAAEAGLGTADYKTLKPIII